LGFPGSGFRKPALDSRNRFTGKSTLFELLLANGGEAPAERSPHLPFEGAAC
jgi:hypothetical protein